MNKKNVIALIAIILLAFVCLRLAATQLCDPRPNSGVAAVVVNAITASDPLRHSAKPDPLSWEPILYRLLGFLSKACPR